MIMQASLENLLNNPFVNHFVDCIENLPNNLQFLLSELRDIDSQVNVYHQKLNNFKETCCNDSTAIISVEQIGIIHNTLIKCRELGDQKVELVSQIINLLDNKTKELMLDTKTLDDRAFKIEVDEDKIVSEFKATIKQRSSSNHHHHHHHKESKNYNVVTKAMSKYMPQTSYEQNCISKSLNHHQSTTTHDNRLLLNGNNTLRQKYLNNQYHLPDRKAKKPRIDEIHQLSSIKSTPKASNENYDQQQQQSHYSATRSKRQLPYTTPQNNNKNNLLMNMKKKRLNLNNQHQSSSPASSSVSTSSSSSLSNRHRDYIRKAKLRAKQKYKLSNNDDLDDDDDDSVGGRGGGANSNDDQFNSNKIALSNINENSNDNNSNDEETSSSSEINSQKNADISNENNVLKNNNNNNVLSTIGGNIEPNEPVYCVCRQISYGQMIMCDNSDCELEWFHFDCVKLTSKPKGKWYCPQCRGDNHKVMRKITKRL